MNENKTSQENNKGTLYILVLILAVASLAFRLIDYAKFEQTALLFVGIPTLITLLLIKYSKTPKSAYGIVFKTITLFLLLASILFGEGLVCIIFMSPIFYGVAALLIFIVELLKKGSNSKLNSFIIIPIVLLLSQFNDINSTPKKQTIITTKSIYGNQSINALNQNPDFLENYPNFFKIGFPKPISIIGTGVEVGDSRKIQFKSNTKGIGVLHLRIKEAKNDTLTFEIVSDNTHIHHWLTWKEVSVSIKKGENDISEITWTTKFTCDLGPNWYFEPLEKYGVKLMNQHLINSFFN